MSTTLAPNPEIGPENEKDLLLAKLLNDDYFKLKLDQEVRVRTQGELNTWWKRIVGIVGVIISIIAVFGIKEYISFKNTVDEAKQRIETDRANAKAAIDEGRKQFAQSTNEVGTLIKEAGSELSKMQGTAASIQAGQVANDARVNQQLSDIIKASNEFHKKFGEFGVDFQRTQSDLKENSKNVAAGLKNAEKLLHDSNDVLASVKREQENEKKRIQTEVTAPLKELGTAVTEVTNKVFSSGSYIIKERLASQEIQTVPKDSNQDLLIDVGRLHVDDLYDFRVTDRRGKLLYENKDLKIGETVTFKSGSYTYTLIARYILRITFGSDAAGIDISWSNYTDKPQVVQSSASQK